MAHARRRVRKAEPIVTEWRPPLGWKQIQAGVWVPGDYRPTKWEVQAPPIRNRDDARADLLRCRNSLPYFAFTWVWTLDVDDPSGDGVRKMPAYSYLRRFFAEVQEPCNIHCEKSRQMIMSWAWMTVFLWDLLFIERRPNLVISKRAKDVDDGGINATPDSNFGKLRFMHEHLPEHLWQRFEYIKFTIRNPFTGSHVKGETGKGSAASRGPTFTRALMDEAAYVERSETVFKGVRQAAKNGTGLNSTPNGKGNVFARIRFSTTTTFKKLRFHWSEHPRKAVGLYCICGWKSDRFSKTPPHVQFSGHNCPLPKMDPPRSPEMRAPWYDEQANDMRPEDVASELDISYEGSRRGIVYGTFDQTRNIYPVMHKLGPRLLHETPDMYRRRYLRLVIDPRLPLVVGWDFGVGDPAAMLLAQIFDEDVPYVRFLDEIEAGDQPYTFFSDIVNGLWVPAAQSVGNRIAFRHYGGHDVNNRFPIAKPNAKGLQSWASNLKSKGINVESRPFGSLKEWIDYIRDTYRNGTTQISDWCAGTIDATQNYHFPLDRDGNPLPGDHDPVHDEWSHKMDAKRAIFKVRFAAKLYQREKRAVTTRRILARGGGYDSRTEHRRF